MTTHSDNDSIVDAIHDYVQVQLQRQQVHKELEAACKKRSALTGKPIAMKMRTPIEFSAGTISLPFDLYYGPQRDQTKPWKLIIGTNATLFIKETLELGGVHPQPPSKRNKSTK